MADDVITPTLKIRNGYAEAPEGPGLGVQLDEEKIRRHSTNIISCR